jgi:hypothetical protein
MAFQKEDSGGDFVDVAWEYDGVQKHTIPGDYLSPYDFEANSLEENLLGKLIVYPQPAHNYLRLDTQGEKGLVKVFSLDGKLIMIEAVDGSRNSFILDVSALKASCYILEFTTGKRSLMSKIIVY